MAPDTSYHFVGAGAEGGEAQRSWRLAWRERVLKVDHLYASGGLSI